MAISRVMAAAVLVLLAGSAAADAMRCGNALVLPGDTDTEVLLKCGEPLSRDLVGVKEVAVKQRGFLRQFETTTGEKVEKWIYRPGGGKFIRILTFQGGVLTGIEESDER